MGYDEKSVFFSNSFSRKKCGINHVRKRYDIFKKRKSIIFLLVQHMVHVILTDAFIYFLLSSLLCHIDGDVVRKRVRRKEKSCSSVRKNRHPSSCTSSICMYKKSECVGTHKKCEDSHYILVSTLMTLNRKFFSLLLKKQQRS